MAVLYGIIFAACHLFCFHKTKEVVEVPVGQKLPLKVQLRSVMKNKPYLLALLGQLLFGFIHYGRNASIWFVILPSAAAFATYCEPSVTRRTRL